MQGTGNFVRDTVTIYDGSVRFALTINSPYPLLDSRIRLLVLLSKLGCFNLFRVFLLYLLTLGVLWWFIDYAMQAFSVPFCVRIEYTIFLMCIKLFWLCSMVATAWYAPQYLRSNNSSHI